MARIIKKAAASSIITPELLSYTRKTPRRNYIFITPHLKKNTSSLIYRQEVLFRSTPSLLQLFSNSLSNKKRSSNSDQIICAKEEAENLLDKVVEIPSEFPFEIVDNPGEQTITLTRKYRGVIKVIVHMPADRSSTVKESVRNQQSSIRLVITCTNYWGTTLEYGVIAYPDEFSVDSFCIKYANAPEEDLENIYYKGPDYAKLDKKLQKEFHRRLKMIGIIPSTTKFLHEYMANRDVYSTDSSSSSTPTPTDQSTPEFIEGDVLINDEGIKVPFVTERYRQSGHPLVSAEDIRNSGKKPEDFIWIPYRYTRSEKLLWIEVPSNGFFAETESELEPDDEDVCNDYDDDDDSSLFFDDGEENPYSPRRLPDKRFGDPPVISEEMDKILYPDVKYAYSIEKFWKDFAVALKPYNDEMDKIKYPNGPPDVVELSDSDLEHYQVWHM